MQKSDVADDWWKSAVVYQVYPRSFADADGDGVGDLRGIRERLDHLELLGVDVVWLSPVYRSPMDDNGYDISDYQDVDPLFGTLADLDALIADVHARGMKLVMDLVVNHTSSAHAWFQESRSGTDSPKRDWYWWRPARPGHTPGEPGAEPTNWVSVFSGPAWAWDPGSGEYYLHLFAASQPDLNWENADVREAVYAMMRWWLDRGVDGFRMDVINHISKVVVDQPPGLLDGEHGNASPHVLNGPRVHEFLKEMHREVFAGRPAGLLNVGETPATSVEQARLYTDAARGELDMVFQFEHVDLDSGPGGKWDVVPMTVRDLKESLGRWQEGLADVGWNSLYLGNHDQPRCVSRYGDDAPEHRVASAKALATVLHLHRGTPYVYQGDELGMTNTAIASVDHLRDIESLNAYGDLLASGVEPEAALAVIRAKSRDHARTPMQWDASAHAGFTTGTPWIEANPNHAEINAAAQVGDPDSVFEHYRRLIALRHDEPVVAHGDFTMLLPDARAGLRVRAPARRHRAARGRQPVVGRRGCGRAGRALGRRREGAVERGRAPSCRRTRAGPVGGAGAATPVSGGRSGVSSRRPDEARSTPCVPGSVTVVIAMLASLLLTPRLGGATGLARHGRDEDVPEQQRRQGARPALRHAPRLRPGRDRPQRTDAGPPHGLCPPVSLRRERPADPDPRGVGAVDRAHRGRARRGRQQHLHRPAPGPARVRHPQGARPGRRLRGPGDVRVRVAAPSRLPHPAPDRAQPDGHRLPTPVSRRCRVVPGTSLIGRPSWSRRISTCW